MTLSLAFAVLLAATVGLITYLLMRRQANLQTDAVNGELAEAKAAFLAAKADFEARQEELRRTIEEAREREKEAKDEAKESDQQYVALAAELKVALEEKGRFQNEATRVEETKETLLERDRQIESLNARVTDLEREKTEALKDAEAANRRATDMVAKEREAQGEIVNAKDEQITKLNEFIGQAREVLTTEFKALSADALKDASSQLVRTADGIIGVDTAWSRSACFRTIRWRNQRYILARAIRDCQFGSLSTEGMPIKSDVSTQWRLQLN
jgi:chromosome segregation ATPase